MASPKKSIPSSVVGNVRLPPQSFTYGAIPNTRRSNESDEETRTLITHNCSASVHSCDSHTEHHFGNVEVVRDIIIGLSDGLTVPFALAAGLSALGSSRLVIIAGMAEIVAGAISMGLGGYLAGSSEIEHYDTERKREQHEVIHLPEREEAEIIEIFEPYGMNKETLRPLLEVLKSDPEKWVDFMMKFELSLERPDPNRTWISAFTIGLSYFIGGLVPLVPYFIIEKAEHALYASMGFTLFVLLVFGYVKNKVMGLDRPVLGALKVTMIGALAAGAAFGLAKLFSVHLPEEARYSVFFN